MLLRFRKVRNVIIFDIEGDVVGPDGEHLVKEFRKALRLSEGKMNFLLNLKRTRLLDSSGIGALVSVYVEAQNAETQPRIGLTQISATVEKLLHLGKLEGLFLRFEDEDSAVRALAH